MEELDKLLDKIILVNNDIKILQKRIKKLPEYVNLAVKKIASQNYLPTEIETLKQKTYEQLYEKFSKQNNELADYRKQLFSRIINLN